MSPRAAGPPTTRDLLRRPIGRLGLVLSLTLIGGFAGWAYGVTARPAYTARAYVVTTGNPSRTVPSARAWGRLATTAPVLSQAAARLGTGASALDRITASAVRDSPVIEIAATASSAARAVTVADAVARALVDYGSSHAADVSGSVAVLAGALTPARPSSPDRPCDLLIGTSAGLLIGALGALANLRRPHRRTAAPTPYRTAAIVSRPAPPTVPIRVARPTFDDPAEIAGHLRIWRARYGDRAVTAYRSAAALTEPALTEPAPTEPAPTEPAPTEPAPTEPRTWTTPEPDPARREAAADRAETAHGGETTPPDTATSDDPPGEADG